MSKYSETIVRWTDFITQVYFCDELFLPILVHSLVSEVREIYCTHPAGNPTTLSLKKNVPSICNFPIKHLFKALYKLKL